MKRAILGLTLILGGCSFRPSDNLVDGSLVYLKFTCEQRYIERWDSFVGRYETVDEKGETYYDISRDLTIDKNNCIRWSGKRAKGKGK